MHHTPVELKYTDEHVWAEELGEGQYRVGITDFAQQELGDIVYVKTPELDEEYSQGDKCATIESVKSASDIYCPLSGIILEVNTDMEDTPEAINADPYGDGWLFIIKINDPSQVDTLLSDQAYMELI